MIRNAVLVTLTAAALASSLPARAQQDRDERKSLTELRNTVVNLLQGLVEQGVLSREKAEQMVRDAQAKATAEAEADAKRDKEEENAIRVPYVPQVVRDEIRKQVAQDLSKEVTENVVEQAKSESWATPGALPDWIRRMRWYGDVRIRGQEDLFADDNAQNNYVNFLTVNQRGGIGKAGADALVNVSKDRERLRARVRIGFDVNLGYGWTLGSRIVTGPLTDAVSTNQTLGNYGARYAVGMDLGYIDWSGASGTGRHAFEAIAGRIRNPYFSTNLVWDEDVTFEGVAGTYKLGLKRDDPSSNFVYLTAGVFPLQELELHSDKWLLGGQLGLDWKFAGGSRLRFGTAYYDYRNITGQRNAFNSILLDYTAPQFLQRGNTLFDIRNDDDTSTNLFALASDYRLVDLTATFDWRVSPGYKLTVTGDAVRNVGYDAAQVQVRTGQLVPQRNKGYQGEVGFGSNNMAVANAWRGYFGYRYLERDAVLDAFTDSDFRLGGTDVKGYFAGVDFALTPRVFTRLRYLSGTEIDGPPLSIDVIQLDLNASF